MNEQINEQTIENTINNTTSSTYKIACNINTMLSVLTFTIIIIFLFKYLHITFKLKN